MVCILWDTCILQFFGLIPLSLFYAMCNKDNWAEAYTEASWASKMELFAQTIFPKYSILDVWLGSEYTSGVSSYYQFHIIILRLNSWKCFFFKSCIMNRQKDQKNGLVSIRSDWKIPLLLKVISYWVMWHATKQNQLLLK